MKHVTVRFHEDLVFFLRRSNSSGEIPVTFHVTRSVKDMAESLGVPHVEIDFILVNGLSVGFDYLLKDGDSVSIFPQSAANESIPANKERIVHLSPVKKDSRRFVADVHVKTLTRYLRMLGFDTLYDREWEDVYLASISENEDRTLLSRDTRLLMRNNVSRGMYIRSLNPQTQVIEVIRRYQLSDKIDPFTRCISCNGRIARVENNRLTASRVPPEVLARNDTFHRCESCGKYYWNGSHVKKMQKRIEDIRREVC